MNLRYLKYYLSRKWKVITYDWGTFQSFTHRGDTLIHIGSRISNHCGDHLVIAATTDPNQFKKCDLILHRNLRIAFFSCYTGGPFCDKALEFCNSGLIEFFGEVPDKIGIIYLKKK